jgi:hypothetical protein
MQTLFKRPSGLQAPPPSYLQPSVTIDEAYGDFLAMLPEATVASLNKLAESDEVSPGPPEEEMSRYFAVELPEGQAPRLRAFKSPEALVKHLGSLDEADTFAVPFFGMPLLFTVRPERYLYLPDGETAMALPLRKGGPCTLVTRAAIDGAEIQDDFYLGPEELSHPGGDVSQTYRRRQADEGVTDEDKDPEDDDDDGEEEGIPEGTP